MKNRTVHAFLRDYIIPPRCPSCGDLTAMDEPNAPFCLECRGKWEREKLAPCETCGLSMLDCACLPPLLTENGIRDSIFLTAYRAGGDTASDRVIFSIKSECDGRTFAFLARELSYQVLRFARLEGLSADRICIASLPRRKSAIRAHGFDQARELARALARETGYPYLGCLERARAGREQKHLSAEARRSNAAGAFRMAKRANVAGLAVFLVDDVMTTGSGLYECASLLYQSGAERVIPTVIARTPERTGG